MISFDKAYDTVMEHVIAMGSETVALKASRGRILAQEVMSDMDMPPFDKSAMDGYACRKQDLGNELTVIEEIPAGTPPTKTVRENECAKIMTGAAVPAGADTVFMVEDSAEVSNTAVRCLNPATKANICYQGEDIRAGDGVLSRGDRIGPQHIAVMAAVGCTQPQVAQAPRVGIISTGSELVEPHEKAGGAKIRNSNGWQLTAQAEATGCIATNYGIAIDTEAALNAAIREALAENDVVILSGGVSMGDHDLVPGILQRNGIELLFTRVAIKPGRPSTFGVGDDVRVFALPGNPVSTFLQFELMVKPFLYRMMGHDYAKQTVRARLASRLRVKPSNRVSILPVRFTAPDRIEPVIYHGSAHINAMCATAGVIFCSCEGRTFHQGDELDVRLL